MIYLYHLFISSNQKLFFYLGDVSGNQRWANIA